MKRILLFAITFAAGVAGAGLALSGADAPARAQPGGAALQQCPERLTGRPSLLCDCPSEATASGSVWGADIYTDDSAICRAALHAGVIGTDGGAVHVVEAPGQDSYPAVTRNSVASNSWPSWGRSIAFRPVDEAGKDRGDTAIAACPDSATSLTIGARLSCGCDGSTVSAGSVWGSGPYTGDSSICRAALHAGATGVRGGIVRLRVTPGEDRYVGSTQHSVSSNNWDAFSISFVFER
jgi:hypothetical protein